MRIPKFYKTIKNCIFYSFYWQNPSTLLLTLIAESKWKKYFIEKKSYSYHYDNVFSKESLKSVLTIPVGDLKEEYF